jgi:hypothetical protein
VTAAFSVHLATFHVHRFKKQPKEETRQDAEAVVLVTEKPASTDWAGSWRGLALIWGLPAAIMAESASLGQTPRGVVWTTMLLFMGGACLANARRCHRTHCRYTGPFLILMAGIVALYTLGVVPLGGNGWTLLSAIAFGGSIALCFISESMLGRYQR